MSKKSATKQQQEAKTESASNGQQVAALATRKRQKVHEAHQVGAENALRVAADERRQLDLASPETASAPDGPAAQARADDKQQHKQHQQQQQRHNSNQANVCAACCKPIRERYLLVALEKQWHEDCLKCACCDCRLGEVGSSLFTHSDKILCRRDFLRIFGRHGNCAACKRTIPPYELVMRANENAYHLDCFSCQNCRYRFCVGDRFHLTHRHKVICVLCHSDQAGAPGVQQAQQPATKEHVSVAPTTAGPEEPIEA